MAGNSSNTKSPSKAKLYEMLAQAVRNTAPELNPSPAPDEKKSTKRKPRSR